MTGASPEVHATWAAQVQACLRDAIAKHGPTQYLTEHVDGLLAGSTVTDWSAFPQRVADCLTRLQARAVLDWRTERADEGRRRFQEEYAEWRTPRSADGKIYRFELTTELPDFWMWLAGRDPTRTLELVGRFAGESKVDARAVYGDLDPLGAGVDETQRASAFANTMLGEGSSPYNDGTRAICCMRQPTNTLAALLGLVVAAARPRLVQDEVSGLIRCANAAEAIPLLDGAAELGRNSDPVLVEHLTRLAVEGRQVALDAEPGVYIRGVQIERLAGPDGSRVPPDWFSLEQGGATNAGCGEEERPRRLVFEVPAECGFSLADIADLATEQPIQFGSDLAELVQLAVSFRTSDPGVVQEPLEPAPRIVSDPAAGLGGCEDVRAGWRDFEAARSGTPMPEDDAGQSS